MNINERFSSVLSSIEFQLARSMPVFNGGKEIVFFYKIDEINKTEYKISEIRYVVLRDIINGNIEVINANDIIPEKILNSVVGAVNMHTLSVEQELDEEDKYLKYYEKLIEKLESEKELNGKEVSELSVLFTRLTEGTKLKEIYSYLGKEFIELISIH